MMVELRELDRIEIHCREGREMTSVSLFAHVPVCKFCKFVSFVSLLLMPF